MYIYLILTTPSISCLLNPRHVDPGLTLIHVGAYDTNAAFTFNGFDDEERNFTIAKTDFQVSKLKFHACKLKQAFYPL